MAFCPKCKQTMGTMDVVCAHCGFDFPEANASTPLAPPGRWHFPILVAGSLVFLVYLAGQTGEITTLVSLLNGLRLLGAYIAFVAVVFGHRCLRLPTIRR